MYVLIFLKIIRRKFLITKQNFEFSTKFNKRTKNNLRNFVDVKIFDTVLYKIHKLKTFICMRKLEKVKL